MMSKYIPPNETGATDDRARLNSDCTTTVIKRRREINTAAPASWTKEGWRLFTQYQETKGTEYLDALNRHVAGICARMGEVSQ